MKVKAVIFNKDRTTTVKILRKGERADKKFSVNSKDYYVNPECYVSTYAKILRLFKMYYFTLYYRENDPEPLPAPEFAQLEAQDRTGISGAELNQIFKPVFYRILADANKNQKQDWIFYIVAGNLLVSLYVAYQMGQIGENLTSLIEVYNTWLAANSAPPG